MRRQPSSYALPAFVVLIVVLFLIGLALPGIQTAREQACAPEIGGPQGHERAPGALAGRLHVSAGSTWTTTSTTSG